jgi:hypothetical protein
MMAYMIKYFHRDAAMRVSLFAWNPDLGFSQIPWELIYRFLKIPQPTYNIIFDMM